MTQNTKLLKEILSFDSYFNEHTELFIETPDSQLHCKSEVGKGSNLSFTLSLTSLYFFLTQALNDAIDFPEGESIIAGELKFNQDNEHHL